MSAVDEIARGCTLIRWQGNPKRCRWCNSPLRYPRRVWCGADCMAAYQSNHVWAYARDAASERDGHRCGECNAATELLPGRRGPLEVHHREPCRGTRTSSCAHHQTNLVTLCAHHHAARHPAAA